MNPLVWIYSSNRILCCPQCSLTTHTAAHHPNDMDNISPLQCPDLVWGNRVEKVPLRQHWDRPASEFQPFHRPWHRPKNYQAIPPDSDSGGFVIIPKNICHSAITKLLHSKDVNQLIPSSWEVSGVELQTIHRFSQSRRKPLSEFITVWKRLLKLSHTSKTLC